MSRYLEDAARVLRDAEELAGSVEQRLDIANGFAALAAIERGLLPASVVEAVVEAILARHTAPPRTTPTAPSTREGL